MASMGLIIGLSVGLGCLSLYIILTIFLFLRYMCKAATYACAAPESTSSIHLYPSSWIHGSYSSFLPPAVPLVKTVAPWDVEYGPNPGIFTLAEIPWEMLPAISATSPVRAVEGDSPERDDQGATTSPSLSRDPPLRASVVPVPATVPGPAARQMSAVEAAMSPGISNPIPGTLPNVYQCPRCPLGFDKSYLLKYSPLLIPFPTLQLSFPNIPVVT